MAADVTLLALPDVDLGRWHAREVMEYRTGQRHFPSEEELLDPETGEGFGMWVTPFDAEVDERAEFDAWFYGFGWDPVVQKQLTLVDCDPAPYEWLEIGPWSPLKASFGLEEAYGGRGFLPPLQVAVWEYFSAGRVLTPGVALHALSILNRGVPDTTIYRSWSKRGTGRGKYRWRSNRTVRPRRAKQWFAEHAGWLVWAESW